MDAAKRGAAALDAGKYKEAIKEYTTAITSMPTAVDYYLQRSTAYQRSSPSQTEDALQDVELAVQLAIKRAKRELIGKAQFRRMVTYFNMERYADAEFLLEIVKMYDPKNNSLPIWEAKITKKMAAVDKQSKVVKIKEVPDVKAPEEKESVPASAVAADSPSKKEVVQTPPNLIKHDWYQNKDNVYFTLLAKGVPKDKATIELEEHSIEISFPTQTGTTFTYTLDPLFAPIDPPASTSNITLTKVELVLVKQTPGRQWKSLEGAEAASTTTATSTIADPIRQAILSAPEKAPAYPTSSKKGPKNWDKVVDDMTKKQPKEDGTEGTEDFDDVGGDPADAFFKHLYKNADEDTRRAINKSYQESGGTVLSTNWAEVGKGRVEISPPDGMEAKKWGE